MLIEVYQMTAAISIHSLVKRETSTASQKQEEQKYFNPLPRKEGDAMTTKKSSKK